MTSGLGPCALSLFVLLPTATPALARTGDLVLLPDDLTPGLAFGSAVAIDGFRAAIAAGADDVNGTYSGSAYVFDLTNGQQIAKLLPIDGAEFDRFGSSLDLAGDRVVVGAPYDDDAGIDSGAAYVFDATSGSQLRKLQAQDAEAYDGFGSRVLIEGDRVFVGAYAESEFGYQSGAVYVFDASSGAQLAKLTAPDAAPRGRFGIALAADAGVLVVGANGADGAKPSTGAVYTFDLASGLPLTKLFAENGQQDDFFGMGVALRNDTLVVGAANVAATAGAVYQFDLASGQEVRQLQPDDLDVVGMGYLVGVGSAGVFFRGRTGSGSDLVSSVYLYDAANGQPIAQITSDEPTQASSFAGALTVEDSLFLVGDPGAPGGGAAYLLDPLEATAIPYCYSQGSAAPCPCGNDGVEGHGCANEDYFRGARLFSTRTPRVGEDAFELRVRYSARNQVGLFLQGDNALGGGAGIAFGDGLRCAGGAIVRIQTVGADYAGGARTSVPIAATCGVSAGDVKRYQWWYRDPGASPCGAGFNLSNGLEVTWAP